MLEVQVEVSRRCCRAENEDDVDVRTLLLAHELCRSYGYTSAMLSVDIIRILDRSHTLGLTKILIQDWAYQTHLPQLA